MTRRQWMAAAGGLGPLALAHRSDSEQKHGQGSQRLPIAKLKDWERLGYGMFLHFGISTFDGMEWSNGKTPAAAFDPDRLDVDQWMQVARDAGMKYAVLTTKHVAGFCLWPSKYTDYSVKSAPRKTDIVGEFVKACERRGVGAGFYYCSFDNHHTFGSVTTDHTGLPYDTVEQVHEIELSGKAYTTSVYQDFQLDQVTELLTSYGKIVEFWVDEPGVLGRGYRAGLYERITSLQPDCIVMANGSYGNVNQWNPRLTWPQDVIGYEPPGQDDSMLPPRTGHVRWRTIEGKDYYLPGEIYDLIGHGWFWKDDDKPRSDADLARIYRQARERGTNLLLDVPPDKHGLIPESYRGALQRLRKNQSI